MEKLNKGAIADLAKQFSKCPSKRNKFCFAHNKGEKGIIKTLNDIRK